MGGGALGGGLAVVVVETLVEGSGCTAGGAPAYRVGAPPQAAATPMGARTSASFQARRTAT